MTLTHDDVPAAIAELGRWLVEGGAVPYGDEPATLLSHGLQAAALADAAGLSDALVVACGLHDVAHAWLVCHGGAVLDRDDAHERLGARLLSPLLPPGVVEPVRLHVAAKRRLCASEPGYLATLSAGSVHSLGLQGGPMDAEDARVFDTEPFAADALALRRIDDAAKVPGAAEMPLAVLLGRASRLASLR
jgi:gamma-butyrobetaine dioxygenase